MAQFSATTTYLNHEITITSDKFIDIHIALAGIAEINKDFDNLCKIKGVDPASIVPVFRHSGEKGEFEYYDIADSVSGKSISLGEKKDKTALIPFYPKGRDGYYDPEKNPKKNQDPTRK